MGALLAPGKRTVTSCLRITGRAMVPTFGSYHQVLNRARWNPRRLARRLTLLLVGQLLAERDPVIIGLDDTIERRWGPRISARAIYRDPVRSSRGHFVKTSGLRWLSFMLLTPLPWLPGIKALPILTLLAPSEGWAARQDRRHKPLTERARQAMLMILRWLPGRRLRRRQQLRNARTCPRRRPARHTRKQAAARRQPLRTARAKNTATAGTAAPEGQAPGQASNEARRSRRQLDADHAPGLVRGQEGEGA